MTPNFTVPPFLITRVMYECGVCCVGCRERRGEAASWSWLVCSPPQLLNHNYNANTIKYEHKYKIQIGMLELTQSTIPPSIIEEWRGRWGFGAPSTPLLSSMIACALATPSPSTTMYLLWGTACGGRFEPLIDVLLSTLNLSFFLSHNQVSEQIVAPWTKTPAHPVKSWGSEAALIGGRMRINFGVNSDDFIVLRVCLCQLHCRWCATELFINRPKLLVNCVFYNACLLPPIHTKLASTWKLLQIWAESSSADATVS